MELMIKGVPKPDPVRFTINVGQSEQVIGLHFDFRFNYLGESRTIVMNSFNNGSWGEELREHNFPFEAGREFEVRPGQGDTKPEALMGAVVRLILF
ncbi:hypothetical protein GJAV_G00142960 [Gymnothorax javanicus]|nr:hypothetical protein GJAV_G00142960 [Gymnothorax javanicus]